jgi:autocrine motility factor receptor
MQLRQIYQQIDARLKRHRNYRRIVAVMDEQYPMANELNEQDTCAICWETLASARRLPCKHLFHKYVVHSGRKYNVHFQLVLTRLARAGHVVSHMPSAA